MEASFTAASIGPISSEDLSTINGALLSHWIGGRAEGRSLSIRYNPVADMFLLIQEGQSRKAWWSDGPGVVSRMGLDQAATPDRVSLIFGERVRQLNLMMTAITGGADIIRYFDPAVSDVVASTSTSDAAVAYVIQASATSAMPCHAELVAYAATIKWGDVAKIYGINPTQFLPARMIMQDATEDAAHLVIADSVAGRDLLVLRADVKNDCSVAIQGMMGLA